MQTPRDCAASLVFLIQCRYNLRFNVHSNHGGRRFPVPRSELHANRGGRNMLRQLSLDNFGPIKHAEVEFGDLTVLVGPQATGKSIFLQLLQLVVDTGYVHDEMRKHGLDWKRDVPAFLRVYFGEGMEGLYDETESTLRVNGAHEPIADFVSPRNRAKTNHVFYIPAQRVLTLANGWPRPFSAYGAGDPFAVRDFSERFRLLMEQEFGPDENLFPKPNRLKREYRDLLAAHVFGGFSLRLDAHGAQKRLVLRQDSGVADIPFMVWSAGQREFVPLLVYQPGRASKNLGIRRGLYDIAQSVAEFFGMKPMPRGVSFL